MLTFHEAIDAVHDTDPGMFGELLVDYIGEVFGGSNYCIRILNNMYSFYITAVQCIMERSEHHFMSKTRVSKLSGYPIHASL